MPIGEALKLIPRIVLISLGNPSPYENTLHSAGHHALHSLQQLLGPSQPKFTKQRYGSKKCLASDGPRYLMLQSPEIMNVSGRWVSRAFREAMDQQGAGAEGENPNPSLLLVHDDLELALGAVKVRAWTSSGRGHNGVKSVNSFIDRRSFPTAKMARISVGIGRPQARTKFDVSEYVLRQMTEAERSQLHSSAGPGVLRCLQEWEAKLGDP